MEAIMTIISIITIGLFLTLGMQHADEVSQYESQHYNEEQ